MLFRFGIHGALSSAALVAAAAPAKRESESTSTGERSMTDALPPHAFQIPSAETNLYETSKTIELRNSMVVHEGSSKASENKPPGSGGTNEKEKVNKNGNGGARATLRNPIVPKSLETKHDPNDEKTGFLHQPALRSVPSASKNRNVPGGKRLDNTSSKEGARYDSDDVEVFDASSELGILNTEAIDKSRWLQENCNGKIQVVSPTIKFQRIVKTCLYYQDNCLYDTSLGLKCWDTSQVTDMSYAFYRLDNFNEPIDSWNTESVTDMSDMFSFASSFNQPLSSWNTSAVEDMSDMFWGADSFDQPIEEWDTSAVVNMDYMFFDATGFNQPLGNWNTESVQDMQTMFAFAYSFNQPIEKWNTKSVKDMKNMFLAAGSFNQPLKAWDVSSVKDMSGMFYDAKVFNQQVDSWETSTVTDMDVMFNRAEKFNQCLSTWAYKNTQANIGNYMFNGTGCTYQGIQNLIIGPWCQGPKYQCYPSTTYTPSSGRSLFGGNQLASAVLLGIVIPNAVF